MTKTIHELEMEGHLEFLDWLAKEKKINSLKDFQSIVKNIYIPTKKEENKTTILWAYKGYPIIKKVHVEY